MRIFGKKKLKKVLFDSKQIKGEKIIKRILFFFKLSDNLIQQNDLFKFIEENILILFYNVMILIYAKCYKLFKNNRLKLL